MATATPSTVAAEPPAAAAPRPPRRTRRRDRATALPSRPTATDLLHHALAASVDELVRLDAVAREEADVEAVHQMRIAVRRLRSHLRTFASFVDAAWSDSVREALAWLGDALGARRDADIRTERLRSRAASLPDPSLAAPLVEAMQREHLAAHESVLAVLGDPRYPALLAALASFAAGVAPHPSLPAEALVAPVQQQWERLRRRVRRLSDPPADAELHRIRIHAKRCRYAAEALEPLFGKDAARFASAAAELQGVLGDLHDACVMRAWLQSRSEADPALAFVAGEVAALELAEIAAGRKAWRKPWKRLATRREPRQWKAPRA